MEPAFHEDETFKNGLGQVNSVRLLHHVAHKCLFCGKSLVEFSEEENAILKESFTNAGANPELKPKKVFDAGREREQEEFGNSHGHTDHKIAEQTGFLNGLVRAFTWKKKSLGDDSNKQNGDQKQEIKVEASETNEGKFVPNMSEEKSNGKDIGKASKNCTNGAEKDNKKSKENDAKDVKADEKPSVGVDKNGAKAAPERKSVIETYKNNKDVRCEDPMPNLQRSCTKVLQRSCTKYISSHLGAESSYTQNEKPGEAQKARAAEVQTKSELLVKNDTTTLEPGSGEVKKEYWSKQVQGGQGRLHDKGQWGGKYNKNGKIHQLIDRTKLRK